MTDAQILNVWLIGLGVAAVVVVIAAALLLAVLNAAKSIERGAGAALGMVKQIRENTQVIWALQDTNQVARQLLCGANAILADAREIAQALHDADARRGQGRARL
ncbi:MAG: hypothetical protein HY868_06295 [Chloroflexi bacterium]|nr:hypothetical protein [Chloroflexota bacterium]